MREIFYREIHPDSCIIREYIYLPAKYSSMEELLEEIRQYYGDRLAEGFNNINPMIVRTKKMPSENDKQRATGKTSEQY